MSAPRGVTNQPVRFRSSSAMSESKRSALLFRREQIPARVLGRIALKIALNVAYHGVEHGSKHESEHKSKHGREHGSEHRIGQGMQAGDEGGWYDGCGAWWCGG